MGRPESDGRPPADDVAGQVGERIRQRMEALGLSQAELARRMGLERRQTINDWLHGRQEPAPAHLRLLRRELSVSVDWLLGVDEEPPYAAWMRFLADLADEGTSLSPEEAKTLRSVIWPADSEPTTFGYRGLLAMLRSGGTRPRK